MDPFERSREIEPEIMETLRRAERESLRIEAELRRVGERIRLVSTLANRSSVRPFGDGMV